MSPLLAARDVPASSLAGDWHVSPAPAVFAVLAVALFAAAFLRVRRRDPEAASARRAALFAAGLALMVTPLVSPLDVAGERYLLSAHMLEHILLADAGPALLVLSVRGPLALALVPRGLPGLDLLMRPPVTLAAWVAVIGIWHVPALYDAALRRPALHDLEHLSFVVVGILAWAQMIDPAGRRRLGLPGRIAFTVAVFFAGQVLSDALVFSFHPYYPAYAGRPARLAGISALSDQRLAGIVMALEQLVTLGTCFCLLLQRLRRGPQVRGSYHTA
jgi:putative membrane protein